VVGAAIGLVVGFGGCWLRSRFDDPPLEIAASILLAYVAYLPAERIHASGVLAAVTAGLYLGWHSSSGAFSARSRLQSTAFWETLIFLVNAALFVLVGLSFHTFSVQARGPLGRLILAGAAVVGTVVVVRLTWMWAFGWLLRSRPGRDQRSPYGGWQERMILGWSGMRGAITLAAVLAVPTLTNAGRPLAGRNDVVYLGFAVIIATLVGQGMTLPFLAQTFHLEESSTVLDIERQARVDLIRTVLDRIASEHRDGTLPESVAEGLKGQYLGRLGELETSPDSEIPEVELRESAKAELKMRHALIALQRQTLLALRDEGRIGVTTLRSIERELDFEEAHLLRG
jgi:CPA1 family monovalent cation:H+ antiporter